MTSRTYRAQLPKGFETRTEADERRLRLAGVLRQGNKAERLLANKLKRCDDDSRCHSGACPVCVGQFRVDLLREGEVVLEEFKDWVGASIVPAGFLFAPGKLGDFDPAAMAKMIGKRLERHFPDVPVVIGGVDISFNLTDNKAGVWQPHLYLIMQGKPSGRLVNRLKAAFAGEPLANRPVHIQALYSHRGPLTYVFKSVFNRRSTYFFRSKQRVRTQSLKDPELRELAVALDRFPLGTRLILKGVRRSGGSPMRLIL